MKDHSTSKHYYIVVTGVVQGVGFRPFVYRTAHELGLKGSVCNSTLGVEIHLEGDGVAVEKFLEQLKTDAPPLAKVEAIDVQEVDWYGFKDFDIIASDEVHQKVTSVSPDVSICEACLQEMRDPSNRRYRYPFINCTDCGPRYTITKTVPYDRPNTSMATFQMCPTCQQEYEDPMDRRYHAQPISCWKCGPTLSLRDSTGKLIECDDPIAFCAERLKEGKIVAIKGLGGFHLMCDATNEVALLSLRERKRRPVKPLAVMVKDIATVETLATFNEVEQKWLVSRERPIVLLKKRLDTDLAFSVAPHIDRIGVMLPYTPLHELLFEEIEQPLVATSANLSDEPIIRTSEVLVEKLGHVVDWILDHDREIVNACDDSVMQVAGDQPIWLRVARGIAPLTFVLDQKTDRKILAVGANQKSTIALAFSNRIVLSPHIGDLSTIEAMEYFERTVQTFKNFYDVIPNTIVHDKHPGYETTKWVNTIKNQEGIDTILEVQHHYAHALGVMAEYGLHKERLLAFCWDGTGYGDDGTIWGGEIFLANAYTYERLGSLRPFRLLGGEKAVKEPRRVALALLFELFSLEEILEMKTPVVKAFHADEIRMLHWAWEKGMNALPTTSMGRLFDAVASLAGICQTLGFEGESGMRIEALVDEDAPVEPYPFRFEHGELDWSEMVRAMVESGDSKRIASRFMATLVEMIFTVAKAYPDYPLLFAGGVFQNRILVEQVMARAQKEGRKLYFPRRLSPNDGAVALGQVWYGLAQTQAI